MVSEREDQALYFISLLDHLLIHSFTYHTLLNLIRQKHNVNSASEINYVVNDHCNPV